MQTLQLNDRIDPLTKEKNVVKSEKNSDISWRDLQGLTWLFEENY